MNEKKRKQKQYYVNQAKRAKFEKKKLHPGLRGFLCTTNNRERECVREAYNLLNEYANAMYGAEHLDEAAGSAAAPDVEQSLEAELAALKQEKASKERRFQQVDSGAKNCIFISTQLERTAPLVERIAQEIRDTGTQRTRYLLRLLPVQVTCKATEEDIRASAESMIKETFTELGVRYTTVFRSRNQSQLTQTDAQTAINSLIDAVCPTARLDHKTPQLTVVMEVIRNVICLGVLRDYFRFKKYNLVELAKGSAAEEGDVSAKGSESAEGDKVEGGGKGAGESEAGKGDAAAGSGASGEVMAEGTDCGADSRDPTEDSAVMERGDAAAEEEDNSAAAEEPTAAAVRAESAPPVAESPNETPPGDATAPQPAVETGAGVATEKPVSDDA